MPKNSGLGHMPRKICNRRTSPRWADSIYIGWLLRILADPKTFLPRYWNARKLKKLVDRWGGDAPAMGRAPE